MPELTAQRTLVKSPPELWTELSDIESLARHLGEFGEIRITRSEPESVVAWEGDNARGTVEIEASGWGTKVVITALLAEPGEAEEEIEAGAEPEGEAESCAGDTPAGEERAADYEDAGVVALEPPVFEADDDLDDPDTFEPEPETAPVAEARRGGFFTRLFARRRRVPDPDGIALEPDEVAAEPDHHVTDDYEPEPAAAPEPVAIAPPPEPVAITPPPEPVAIASEPAATEPEPTTLDWGAPDIEWAGEEPGRQEAPAPGLAPERAQAVLDATLDNLGSAHHRPFSRG